ncbi:MAG: twin-arginine translocase subunit TatC [Candidatus Krumholzibacteria bacterium]|nr:twin-arginine translocase subunit TatC [Candidatus Krumholzibacteria bacterium]
MAEERKEHLKEMGLLDHLEELRSALISVLVAWVGVSAVLWFFSARILEFLIKYLPVKDLYFFAPGEAFMVRTKLSFILGILVSAPYILFRVWRFVSPGLFRKERGLVFPVVVLSVVLFYLGLLFAYWVMMPLVLRFFVTFGTESLTPMLSVDRYFSFVAKLSFAFGLVFQLPLVIILLTWMGVVSARTLLRQWRWAIVIIFSVAAVLTPPDPISQICMAVPLCVLFFASVAASFVIERRGKKPDAGDA